MRSWTNDKEESYQLTRAPREVSGYSVRFHKNFLTFPTGVEPKSSTDNLSIYFLSDSS